MTGTMTGGQRRHTTEGAHGGGGAEALGPVLDLDTLLTRKMYARL